MFSLVLTLLVAFPELSAPEKLVDLETAPLLSANHLVAADERGALCVTFHPTNPDQSALWWVPFTGDAVLVHTTARTQSNVTRARRLDSGDFIVLEPEGVVLRVRIDGTNVEVVPLMTLTTPASFVEGRSTNRAWLFDTTGIHVTDGQLTEQLVMESGLRVVVESEGRLAGVSASNVMVWNSVGARDSIVVASSVSAIPGGFLFGGTSLRTESGEVLIAAPCRTFNGTWAHCTDALTSLQQIYSTDGTLAGTTLRKESFSLTVLGSSDAHLVFFSDGMRLLDRTSERVLAVGCSGFSFVNQFAACANQVIDLRPGGMTHLLERQVRAVVAAGARVLVLDELASWSLFDSAGGVETVVPDFHGPTQSSYPQRLSSNRVTALFGTQKGVWLTDGTAHVRVGDTANSWGRGALGVERDGGLAAFDEHARPFTLPAGIQTVSGEWLLGLDGCNVFRIDTNGVRESLQVDGCATQLRGAGDGAFIVREVGDVLFVKPPAQPRVIPRAIDINRPVLCGTTRCWAVTTGPTQRALSFSATASDPEVNDEGVLDGVPVLASNTMFVTRTASSHFVRSQSAGKTVQVPDGRFAVINSTEHVFILSGDDEVTVVAPDGTMRASEAGCLIIELASDGARVFGRCQSRAGEESLFAIDDSATITHRLTAGAVSFPHSDGTLEWRADASKRLDFFSFVEPRLVASVDGEERVLGSLFATNFATVRAGIVFAGTETSGDTELWVVRYQHAGCGCGTGDALFMLALVFVRRARKNA